MVGRLSTVDEPSRKGHMTCEAFEWLYVCVYTHWSAAGIKTVDRLAGPLQEEDDLRVRICLSRCSSRVKDCPQ